MSSNIISGFHRAADLTLNVFLFFAGLAMFLGGIAGLVVCVLNRDLVGLSMTSSAVMGLLSVGLAMFGFALSRARL